MKIKPINLGNLRNDEHFQFNTEFRTMVKKHGADCTHLTVANADTPTVKKDIANVDNTVRY
jgi:peptidase E